MRQRGLDATLESTRLKGGSLRKRHPPCLCDEMQSWGGSGRGRRREEKRGGGGKDEEGRGRNGRGNAHTRTEDRTTQVAGESSIPVNNVRVQSGCGRGERGKG